MNMRLGTPPEENFNSPCMARSTPNTNQNEKHLTTPPHPDDQFDMYHERDYCNLGKRLVKKYKQIDYMGVGEDCWPIST